MKKINLNDIKIKKPKVKIKKKVLVGALVILALAVIAVITAIIINLVSWKPEDPEYVVNKYLTAVKEYNTEEMDKYESDKTDIGIDKLHLEYTGAKEAIFDRLSFNIGDFTLSEDGITATGKVHITTVDMAPAMKLYSEKAQEFFDAGEGLYTNDDYAAIFVAAVNVTADTREFDVEITVVKKGDSWVVRTDDEDLLNAVTGGLYEYYEGIKNQDENPIF